MKLKSILLTILLASSLSAVAQNGTSILPQSALEYMLQRPSVAKHYKEKRIMDRAFLEAGFGLNNTLRRNTTANMDWGHFGFNGRVAFGDWLTPEHGFRIGLEGNIFRRTGISNKAKAYGISADYLMNLSAIASRNYEYPRTFEVIGTAGFDILRSHMDGEVKWASGLHLGLRGQVNLSNYTYFYLEPRISVFDDNLLHRESRLGWRPTASISAGLGYRLVPGTRVEENEFKSTGMLLDNTFLSFSAGPAVIANADRSVWKKQTGARAFGFLGRWFDPYNGLRLGFSLMEYEQNGQGQTQENGKKVSYGHVKGGQLSAEYILNMNNAFGGFLPKRQFWVNTLVGAHYSYLQTGNGKKWVPGVGIGLQANLRLADYASLFVEPRLDLYPKKYAAYASTSNQGDLAASLLMGITISQTGDMTEADNRNESFNNAAWYDHTFIEGSVGGMIPLRSYSLHHPKTTLAPTAQAGVGKWFTPLSGVRLKAEAGQARWDKDDRRSYVTLGADYLWNISSAATGYDPDRSFELIGFLGLHGSAWRNRAKFYYGANVGLRGLWNATPTTSFFIEPIVYAYDNAFLPGHTASSFKLDLMAAMRAGVQFNINASEGINPHWYDAGDGRTFYSLSAGGLVSPIGLRGKANMGVTARAAFGRWYSPVSAWRVGIGTQAMRHKGGRRNTYSGKLFLGADYLTDITAATFGENPDRAVSLRSVFGGNIALRYKRGKSTFCPDVHAGLQLGLNVGKGWEIYGEPLLTYQLEKDMDDKAERLLPSIQLGVNYAFRRGDRVNNTSEKKQFAELMLGPGAFSGTVTSAHPVKRKYTFTYGASYGRKVSDFGALRAGLTRTLIHKTSKKAQGSELTSLHLDYVHSLLPNDDGRFHLRAAAGVSINARSMQHTTRWAPGLNFSAQAAYELSPSVELYAEPNVTMIGKHITPGTKHPMEGEGKLLFGTRIKF